MALSSLLDGSKSMSEASNTKGWMKNPGHDEPITKVEGGHNHEAGHHRKEGVRAGHDHTKPRKNAEGLKKSFYGSKSKEG